MYSLQQLLGRNVDRATQSLTYIVTISYIRKIYDVRYYVYISTHGYMYIRTYIHISV